MSQTDKDAPQPINRSDYSEDDLKKLDSACEQGETWCTNGKVHKCNSEGKWYATGTAC